MSDDDSSSRSRKKEKRKKKRKSSRSKSRGSRRSKSSSKSSHRRSKSSRSRSHSRSKDKRSKKHHDSNGSTTKKRSHWDQGPEAGIVPLPQALMTSGAPAIPPTSRTSVPNFSALQAAQAASISLGLNPSPINPLLNPLLSSTPSLNPMLSGMGGTIPGVSQNALGGLSPEMIAQLTGINNISNIINQNNPLELLNSPSALMLLAAQGSLLGPGGVGGAQPQRMDQIRRTVFVGNITPTMTEEQLRDFLNMKVMQVPDRPPNPIGFPTQPIISATIKRDKMYAFVEFFSQTDADICMCMDGIEFQGTPLKVRRHSDYTPDPKNPPKYYPIPGIISTQVENDNNKIFLGPLPLNLNDDEVKKFVCSFGPLKAFTLVKDIKTGASKGYAFFSYVDASVTDAACEGLNGINLGGKEVVCRRANLPGYGTQKAGAAKGVGMNYDTLCPVPTILECAMPPPASRILVLQNCGTSEELSKEEKDILEDIRSECKKYGEIKNMTLYGDRIFVEYTSVDHAVTASGNLSGRRFNNRVVITTFLSEFEWISKSLD